MRERRGGEERERDRELRRGGGRGREREGGAYPTRFGPKSSEPLKGAGHLFSVKREPYTIHVKK